MVGLAFHTTPQIRFYFADTYLLLSNKHVHTPEFFLPYQYRLEWLRQYSGLPSVLPIYPAVQSNTSVAVTV